MTDLKTGLAVFLFVTILWQADVQKSRLRPAAMNPKWRRPDSKLFGTYQEAADPLKCRRCIRANSLDDCSYSIPCPADEICYMDEVITESLTIEYNGGCRPRDVCTKRPTFAGKRAASGPVTACSKCCDTDRKPECNTKLCGIKSSQSNLQQCYHCESSPGGGGSGVKDPNLCTNLVSCQSDEYCSADTYRLSENVIYEFSCITKGICKLLTTEALHRKKECEEDPSVCPDIGTGRRETSGFRVCTACCGDSQCNGDACEEVIDRLYKLWRGGVLDLSTLKSNGTLPKPTTAATSPSTTFATSPTTVVTSPTTVATSPTTVATIPTTVATSPTTVATSPTTVATSPTTVTTSPTTVATSPTTVATSPTTVATSPTTVATSPTTAVTIPTTVATSPITVATSPTTVVTSPTTVVTSPTTVVTSPTTVATSPTTVVTSPTTVVTSPTTVATSPTSVATSPTTVVTSPSTVTTSPTTVTTSPPPTVASSPSAKMANSPQPTVATGPPPTVSAIPSSHVSANPPSTVATRPPVTIV